MRAVLRVLIIILLTFFPIFVGADPASETILLHFDSFQEGSAILNTGNIGNRIEESNITHSSSITDSFKWNNGLFNLNQASGSLNNQSNTAIITFTSGNSLSDIQIDYFGVSTGNTIKYSGISHRTSLIENSFENSKGLYMVNQSPGNLNQQSNIFFLSLGSSIMLSDDILATKVGNNVLEYAPGTDVERKDILRNSFSGTSGVAIVNQSSGDLNMIRSTLAISFSKEIIR